MTNKLSIHQLPLQGEKVLLRVDFNVPLSPEGKITDDTRIREALPTIQYILKQGGSVILMSHLGRPKGKKDPQFSLAPCQKRLSELLGIPVLFAPDCVGPQAETMAEALLPGQVLMLENLRFYPAEEDPDSDPSFAQKLAKLGDLYVNDAFGTAHRKHASTASIAHYFPGKRAVGLLMEKEIAFFDRMLTNPKRPFYALIGGAKIGTKLGVLSSLVSKVDALFIGGGMAFTFLKAQGIAVGDSLVDDDDACLAHAKELLKSNKIHLPKDLLIADAFKADAAIRVISVEEGIPKGWQGMDIGPQTVREWAQAFQKAKTVFWNGPVGVFEFPRFGKGTEEMATAIAALNATTVVGGGDSVAAVNACHLADRFSHVSTGGGASLEYIEFGHLPGIDAVFENLNAKPQSR